MINRLDHIVLTTTNLDACIDFYQRVLKMEVVTFGEQRHALSFGQQKSIFTNMEKNSNPKRTCLCQAHSIYALLVIYRCVTYKNRLNNKV